MTTAAMSIELSHSISKSFPCHGLSVIIILVGVESHDDQQDRLRFLVREIEALPTEFT